MNGCLVRSQDTTTGKSICQVEYRKVNVCSYVEHSPLNFIFATFRSVLKKRSMLKKRSILKKKSPVKGLKKDLFYISYHKYEKMF